MTQQNQPIRRLRIGNIGAAIFENRTEEGKTFYNVQFTRGYRTDDGWKNTRSFGKDDLLAHAKLCDQAHSWICEQLQAEPSESIGDSEE
ncbi:hypothetical protein Pan44_51670 [Caulifigura coniformis]|uniref:Uncharacterized protein n=1 Tax=Caulifigura coniformis TaxID=2527983 RepID=A0A517SLV7_9PLAN|nr:hypothetical protein [Caulifigura coniformis]QDT57101.1 hypothetical protein Pan44_51670 [Caulifigura coniformis]